MPEQFISERTGKVYQKIRGKWLPVKEKADAGVGFGFEKLPTKFMRKRALHVKRKPIAQRSRHRFTTFEEAEALQRKKGKPWERELPGIEARSIRRFYKKQRR